MDKDNKKVVLVTGSTGGLGTAMCKKLYNIGCRVVANYRNKEKAECWQNILREEGYDIDIYEGNVADYFSI